MEKYKFQIVTPLNKIQITDSTATKNNLQIILALKNYTVNYRLYHRQKKYKEQITLPLNKVKITDYTTVRISVKNVYKRIIKNNK